MPIKIWPLKKIIQKFWPFVFYCFFKYELKTRYVYKYLNPFFWLDKIRDVSQKRNFEYDSKLEFKDSFLYDKSNTMVWAGIDIAASLAMLVCLAFNMIGGRRIWRFIVINTTYEILFIVALVLICWSINYFILFRNKRYLIYFNEFEKYSKQRKWWYGVGSFIFLVLTVACFFYSFKYFS